MDWAVAEGRSPPQMEVGACCRVRRGVGLLALNRTEYHGACVRPGRPPQRLAVARHESRDECVKAQAAFQYWAGGC